MGAVERPLVRATGQGEAGGCNHGDRLAYKVWTVLVESQQAYSEKFTDPAALSSSQADNPLESLTWHEACQRGGDSFTFKGIKFVTKVGVHHWSTAKGRWVPQTAVASLPCRRCQELGVQEDLLKHWHFQRCKWS